MIGPRRRLRNPAIWVQAGLVIFLLLGAVLLRNVRSVR